MAFYISEGLSSNCWVPTNYKTASTDHILMCYPMGDNGKTLSQIFHDKENCQTGAEEIIRIMLSDLSKAFGENIVDHYIDSMIQDWTTHPYVNGSYSYPMPSTYANNNSMRIQLAKPVNEQLFFAGEGTNNNNPSCVPGAMQEGERAALHIHQRLGGQSNPPIPL